MNFFLACWPFQIRGCTVGLAVNVYFCLNIRFSVTCEFKCIFVFAAVPSNIPQPMPAPLPSENSLLSSTLSSTAAPVLNTALSRYRPPFNSVFMCRNGWRHRLMAACCFSCQSREHWEFSRIFCARQLFPERKFSPQFNTLWYLMFSVLKSWIRWKTSMLIECNNFM